MYYRPELGRQGNIELALEGNQHRSNEIFNETNNRSMADRENREAVEQENTDRYLDNVLAQQFITELELRIIALEEKINGLCNNSLSLSE